MSSGIETIVAPATPPGEGGIGIIRLSGPRSFSLLGQIFRPAHGKFPLQSHHLYFGRFFSPGGDLLDQGMAVVMQEPRSYTGEDVAEIHCHGGRVVMGRILDQLTDLGARLARPGEFTLRAYLNGRVDLAQAEAVIDLIHSRTEAANKVALGQLEGKLSQQVFRFRDEILDILAFIEAFIDFPEEEIGGADCASLIGRTEGLLNEIKLLLESFECGRLLREGISVLILGKPNVGKSSLLNALLGESRAIVTEVAGTTRDFIEEQFSLGGFPLRLVDTAGIRSSEDAIEKEGVRRTLKKVESADLILFVVDGSRNTEDDDVFALERCRSKAIMVVRNKSDLGVTSACPAISPFPQVCVSARTGAGLDQLRDAVVEIISGKGSKEAREAVLLSDRRHREAIVRAHISLSKFVQSLKDQTPPEFLAVEMRDALEALGEITGETAPDEILHRIFSRFCIGK